MTFRFRFIDLTNSFVKIVESPSIKHKNKTEPTEEQSGLDRGDPKQGRIYMLGAQGKQSSLSFPFLPYPSPFPSKGSLWVLPMEIFLNPRCL